MLCTAILRRSNAPAFDVSSVTKQRVSKRKVHNVSTINSYHIPIWSKEYFDRFASRNPTLIPMAQTYPCSQDGNHRGDSSDWRIQSSQRLVFRVLQSDELVPDNMAHVSAQAAHQIWYAIIETKDYSEFLFHDSEQYHSKGDVFRIVHLRRSIFCYYCSVRRLQQALGNAQHKKLRSY
jgi:hypothetical protein